MNYVLIGLVVVLFLYFVFRDTPRVGAAKAIGETLRAVVIAVVVVSFVRALVVVPTQIPGREHPGRAAQLLPELHPGDHVLVLRTPFLARNLQRGDLVRFHWYPEGLELVSRVIGLPGETVELRGGLVLIDGRALDERHVVLRAPFEFSLEVPEDEYFLLPDRRDGTAGSHTWGTIALSDIRGRLWFRYWPPRRMGRLPRPVY